MNIIKKIFGYFNQTKKYNITKNLIIYSIDKNGDTDLEIFITDDSENSAKHFASFVYLLNSGIYYKDIISTLLMIKNNQPDFKNFVDSCVLNLDKYFKYHLYSSKPIVSPTSFSDSK